MDPRRDEPMKCSAFVELVTEYFEKTLSTSELQRFERHRAESCDCHKYLEQVRLTVQVTARLAEDSLPPASQSRLLETFRKLTRDP